MTTLTGLATARGLACGPVFVYRTDNDIPILEYIVSPGEEENEMLKLEHSISQIRKDLEIMIDQLKLRTGRNDVRVFECHLMILEDAFLIDEITKRIKKDRLNAEAAVKKVFALHRTQFERMNDPYFRERVRDLDDVERRLLKSLTGDAREPHLELKSPSIIIANDLTPSETVQLPREYVLGFATNGGSPTSHVALLARALAIPAVTGLGDITSRVAPGETILLDGSSGVVEINPDEEYLAAFKAQIERERALTNLGENSNPAGTLKDGSQVAIHANIHPGIPLAGFREKGARGVGLYRSEYLWLNAEKEPTEEEQYQAYSEAVRFTRALGPDATITIRVLDIGGDKIVKGISQKETNPFLGNRSIRYLLSHPDVFKTQLRAILRASAEGHAKIMYPMVSCIEELKESAKILAEVKAALEKENIQFDKNIQTGAMIEIPSAALNAEEFLPYVDFFSIGTNDLVQYTMAADRGNESVAYLYQPLNRAVIKLVKMTLSAAKKKGIPVSVCGESAADPVIGPYWAALGVDVLSMSATYIPVMAKILSSLTRAELDEYASIPDSLPADSTCKDIIDACKNWMLKKIPQFAELIS